MHNGKVYLDFPKSGLIILFQYPRGIQMSGGQHCICIIGYDFQPEKTLADF